MGGRDFTHALARKMAQKFAEENLPEGVSELQLTQMARQLLTKAEDGNCLLYTSPSPRDCS